MTNQEKHALIAEELLEWHGPPPTGVWELSDFDPSTDLNACARAEQAIAERGLGADYAGCMEIVLGREAMSLVDVFEFIRASGQQRVDAMVMLIANLAAHKGTERWMGTVEAMSPDA